MKIISVECLKLTLPPLAAPTPPRPSPKARRGNPRPINKYPDMPRARAQMPGDVTGEMWVRVVAEDGTFGVGNCHWGDFAEPVIRALYAPLIVGRDCMATEYLNDLMWRASQRFGPNGIPSLARSAIDIALWDLRGKLLKAPVYQLLGGPSRDYLDCYVTTSDVEWAMELGFRAFKIGNTAHYEDGIAGLNQVEDTVAAARETVGPDAELMLNTVMGYNVEFAVRVMERLRPYHLRWAEEPLMPHDIDGLRAIKQAVPTVPLATGEDLHGRHDFKRIVDHRAVDVLQPDLRWCGGITEAVKIYTLGEAAGMVTSLHAGAGQAAGQHFCMAMPEAGLAECVMLSPAGVPLNELMRIPGVPVPKDGKVTPSDAPGLGYDIPPSWFAPWPR
ncbi:MAG TPA: mandelate racemase/muconate lactonizing enzyme family protein [Devosiaceae bacterium]|jgi:L-rhamnonate dehydratase